MRRHNWQPLSEAAERLHRNHGHLRRLCESGSVPQHMVKRGRLPRSTMNQSGWMIRDDFTLADRLPRPASKRTLSARAESPIQAAAPTQPQVATPISIHVAGVRVTLTTHTRGHVTIDIDRSVFGSGSKGV